MQSDYFYAVYYDLLYSHRDVKSEVDFLERVFHRLSEIPVRSVLDVGCGTGIHSIELARRGYKVLGVDISEVMISKAKAKAAGLDNVSFVVADARCMEFAEKFDAAIAMYGVISYFTTDDDLLRFLGNLRRTLRDGACFVFDTWSMLGVLEKRVYYETPSVHFRKSGSTLAVKEEQWSIDVLDQVSTAEISWSVLDLKTGYVDVMNYELRLRLYTPRELKHLLSDTGFKVVAIFESFGFKNLSESSSELVVVARAE